jgi:catechol 2,3-dioxygenase-like lactoylglutathione lyase family enzyme
VGPQPTIDELVIADEAEAWRALGFAVEGDTAAVGRVRLRFEGRGERRGIVRWYVRRVRSLELDGLESHASERPPVAGAEHPNGVVAIDHVVVLTPDLDRSVAVLRGAGFDFRRLREGATPGGSLRQAFFRMDDVILELVLAPEGTSVARDPHGPARLWGISFLVRDMDATAAALGERLGAPRDAVQPGRRIATLRPAAGVGPAVAFMT